MRDACSRPSPRTHRPAAADDVEDFYRGQTLTLMISYTVGGGYDLYARVLAQYLGKYIPGHPTVVPENMPGAGGLAREQLSLHRRAERRLGHRHLFAQHSDHAAGDPEL